MSTKILTFILLALSFTGLAQEFIIDQSPEVIINNKELKYPWAGGLNSVNASMIDLDLDGLEDLVVFERSTKEIYTFLAVDAGNFEFAPQHSAGLPSVNGWMIAKDYNGDGRKDIFTSDPLGIRLYINKLPAGFELYPVAPILSKGVVGNINIYLSEKDMPAIEDLDNDGDLDIISMQFAGTSLEFHKNLQVEQGLSSDTIVFEQESSHWGNVRICDCDVVLNYTENCPEQGRTEDTEHLSGHSLLLIDIDADTDYDLLYSDSNCKGMNFLLNTGTPTNAILQEQKSFQLPEDINMVYPAPSYDDFDHDGVKDLILSPTSSGSYNYSMDFSRSVWFYKNHRATNDPDFSLSTQNYLQEHMIDEGLNVFPEFYDFDNDGDQDLFLGLLVDFQKNFMTGMSYYENIGTYGNPAFKLITKDVFGLSANQIYNIKPQFTDVTGDRKPELVFMATGLYGGVTSLYYFENTGLVNFNSDFTLNTLIETLPFGSNYAFSDVNDNGNIDILITTPTGVRRYELQDGESSLKEETFMDLPANIWDVSIEDIDDDGTEDLLYSLRGFVYAIYDFKNNEEAELVDFLYVEGGEPQYSGQLIKIESVKLLGNDKPELILGNIAGGLKLYRNADAVAVPENDPFILFPNPQERRENLEFMSNRNMLISVYSSDGKVIVSEEYIPSNNIFQLQLRNMAPGMYIINAIVDESTSFQRKFVVLD